MENQNNLNSQLSKIWEKIFGKNDLSSGSSAFSRFTPRSTLVTQVNNCITEYSSLRCLSPGEYELLPKNLQNLQKFEDFIDQHYLADREYLPDIEINEFFKFKANWRPLFCASVMYFLSLGWRGTEHNKNVPSRSHNGSNFPLAIR